MGLQMDMHCPFWSHREGGGGVRTQGQTYDQNYNLLFKGPTPYHMQGISKRHVARLSLGRTYLPGLMGISQTYQLKTSSSPNHSRSQINGGASNLRKHRNNYKRGANTSLNSTIPLLLTPPSQMYIASPGRTGRQVVFLRIKSLKGWETSQDNCLCFMSLMLLLGGRVCQVG